MRQDGKYVKLNAEVMKQRFSYSLLLLRYHITSIVNHFKVIYDLLFKGKVSIIALKEIT